jgi:hypothetical protein
MAESGCSELEPYALGDNTGPSSLMAASSTPAQVRRLRTYPPYTIRGGVEQRVGRRRSKRKHYA